VNILVPEVTAKRMINLLFVKAGIVVSATQHVSFADF